MSSIEITSITGKWKEFTWHLLTGNDSANSIFYSPCLKTALLITRALGEKISGNKLPDTITKVLERKSISPVLPATERPKAFHLAIGLTNNCTLNCLYCHAEADKNIIIDPELIDIAVEYAFQQAGKTPKKTLTVSYAVGGEPTMPWKLFRDTILSLKAKEKIKHHGVEKVFLSMTTNCYYGNEKRAFIADNFNTLTLSLDGTREIHNTHRPARDSSESYDTVIESCGYFINSPNVKTGLRSTVSAQSVSELSNIVLHFNSLFGNNFSITFEPLVQIGRALKNTLDSPDEDEFAINFWKAYKTGQALGINVTSSGVNINRLLTQYCGAMSIPSFTLCTDGTITACHRDQDGTEYGYGKIDRDKKEVILDMNKIEKNIALAGIPAPCGECFAQFHCAGDCPDIRKLNYSRCRFNRYIIYKQLEDLLLKNKKAIPVSVI